MPHPPSTTSSAGRWTGRIGLAALAGFTGYTLLCITAPWFWCGELAANWRWHAGQLGLPIAGLLALGRRPWPTLAALAQAVWHIAPVLSLSFGSPPATGAPSLRVASANVYWGTESNATLRDWLLREKFDLVALQELDHTRLELLDELRALYPHQLRHPRERADWNRGTWGQAIFSRQAFTSTAIHHGGWRGQPFLEARSEFDGEPLMVIGAHAMRPGRAWRIESRDQTFNAIASLARGEPRTLVLGDLNATLYSPAFRELLAAGNLRDSRSGFGRQGSWLAGIELRGRHFAPGLRLAIDHVLVGSGLEVIDRRLGPDLGSDHLPVLAELSLR